MINYKEYRGFLDPESDRSLIQTDNNINLTAALFLETADDKSTAMYTLREFEYNGYPSAYLIYMNSADEYEAAMKLVGSMRHWEKLCGSKWFMEGKGVATHRGLEAWRLDMVLRDQSNAKRLLIEQAEQGSVTAQRILFEAGGTRAVAKKDAESVKKAVDSQKSDNVSSLLDAVRKAQS